MFDVSNLESLIKISSVKFIFLPFVKIRIDMIMSFLLKRRRRSAAVVCTNTKLNFPSLSRLN